jgi:hypothetical protein
MPRAGARQWTNRDAATSRQYRFSPLLYLIAFGLAFVSVATLIVACLALAIFFGFAGRPTCASSVKE